MSSDPRETFDEIPAPWRGRCPGSLP